MCGMCFLADKAFDAKPSLVLFLHFLLPVNLHNRTLVPFFGHPVTNKSFPVNTCVCMCGGGAGEGPVEDRGQCQEQFFSALHLSSPTGEGSPEALGSTCFHSTLGWQTQAFHTRAGDPNSGLQAFTASALLINHLSSSWFPL